MELWIVMCETFFVCHRTGFGVSVLPFPVSATHSFEESCKASMHLISMSVHDMRLIRITTFFSVNLRNRIIGVDGKVWFLVRGNRSEEHMWREHNFSVRTANSYCINNDSVMRTERRHCQVRYSEMVKCRSDPVLMKMALIPLSYFCQPKLSWLMLW